MKRLLLSLFALAFSCSFAIAQSAFPQNVAVKSTLVANNTTAVNIKTTGGTVYQVDAYNNGTTLAYIKLYNTATATCGSGTPYARYVIPFGATSSGGGFVAANINGDAYVNGIWLCVTTGIADNDTSAPAASTYIVNIHFH